MKILRLLTCLFLGTFGIMQANAQMTTSSVFIVDSFCESDGKVKVLGDVTYLTTLTGNGIPQQGPFTSADFPSDTIVFENLAPGNYTVTQFDPNNSDQMTYPAIVGGNYKQNWTFTSAVDFGSCVGGTPTVSIGNFQITDATIAQQRPTYNFRISTKGGSLPSNGSTPPLYDTSISGSFPITYPSGLGGNYEIQAIDACGNYKTKIVNVPAAAPQPTLTSQFVSFNNCAGDANYKFTASNGTPNYTFEITAGPDQIGVNFNHSSEATFALTAGGTYTIRVTDECGGVRSTTVTPSICEPYNNCGSFKWCLR
ncbi:hypothetical protein SAMN06298216_3957 [Spirosomataceae bacterium TFI 002]|nr:hypothetical protein SAMN06298216_3957 [Spirosomataceae bacterium TFI 002]